VSSSSMLTLMSMRKVGNLRCWLNSAVKLILAGRGDSTILSIDDGVDLTSVKTEALNGNILSTGGVS